MVASVVTFEQKPEKNVRGLLGTARRGVVLGVFGLFGCTGADGSGLNAALPTDGAADGFAVDTPIVEEARDDGGARDQGTDLALVDTRVDGGGSVDSAGGAGIDVAGDVALAVDALPEGGTDAGRDGGVVDAGQDTGVTDTGIDAGRDAGPLDTGQSDTGQSDTGQSDTGQSDTGQSDTGRDAGFDLGVDIPAPVDQGTTCTGVGPSLRVAMPAANAMIETCTRGGLAVFYEFSVDVQGGATPVAVDFAWRTPDGVLVPPSPPTRTTAPYAFSRQVGGPATTVQPLAVFGLRGTWNFEVVARDACGRTAQARQPFTLIFTTRQCPNP